MKINFKLSIVFILLISISNSLLALTLSKMQVNSKQDEPLNAIIDVVYSKGDKASNLKPAIASKENYEANGLSRLPIHSDIQIRLEDGANGANNGKIYLISKEIVKDPFLDLLIQIDSEKGRVYKEYTVLLEPPSPKTSVKKVEETKSNEIKSEEVKDEVKEVKTQPVKKTQPDKNTTKKVKEVKKPTQEKELKYKIVKSNKGKTLYQIARENKASGVTTEQMVFAIYKNNPEAFSEKNVNTLIKNKKLKIPPVSYFKNHSHLEARKILRTQNTQWKNKFQKINKPIKELIKKEKSVNEDTLKISQLEKELVEAKKKLEDIEKLNLESKNTLVKELNEPLKKENSAILNKEKPPKEKDSEDLIKENNDGVFVSSISDIDENKIIESEIDIDDKKEFETIHILLLLLFLVLLFGLFVVISRRKANERNQTLSSFVDDKQHSSQASFNPQEEININDLDNKSNKTPISKSDTSENKKNYLPIADDD